MTIRSQEPHDIYRYLRKSGAPCAAANRARD